MRRQRYTVAQLAGQGLASRLKINRCGDLTQGHTIVTETADLYEAQRHMPPGCGTVVFLLEGAHVSRAEGEAPAVTENIDE